MRAKAPSPPRNARSHIDGQRLFCTIFSAKSPWRVVAFAILPNHSTVYGRNCNRRTERKVKDLIILGGPNGAGKTTAAQVLLPEELRIHEFVNADEIARGLSPFNTNGVAVAAGRLMIERMRTLAHNGESFAFETTCAGRAHANFVRQCRSAGWRVILLYLWLSSPRLALDRVATRVRAGGHHIPRGVVIRRYWAGLTNMRQLYLPLADIAVIYDNGDDGRALIAERTPQTGFVVHDAGRWALIEKASS
ncbi:MAG: zeta toxin family protein [Alphaproteobacteria bacterium]|nr:zeta toxin family protein [Alphaproteobacteria bacterium]